MEKPKKKRILIPEIKDITIKSDNINEALPEPKTASLDTRKRLPLIQEVKA